jgi:hypothetical protein
MSDDAPHNFEWNLGLERVVKKEGEQAESMYVLHHNAYKTANRFQDCIMIPSIILQTITGFLSASDLVNPMILGSISILTGILSTLISYYKFSAKAEGHRVVALLYFKIYKLVEVELSLPVEQRMSASKLLSDVRKKISHIQEISPEIPDSVINSYKTKFKDISSAKPLIANGIDEIQVYEGKRIVESISSPKFEIETKITPE